ncbi:response regulator [Paenibacillus lautus]|uniref:response regulator transcription factor n=1 Tax=Paenibacillus lautus TaxID=1401 RepID=UPI003D2BCB44
MRLLIADDEPVIRRGLVKMAETYRLQFDAIDTAVNGEHALSLIKEFEPDVLLTDIRMPRMGGLELCQELHELYGHIQIIVISGYGEFQYAQQCLAYGVKHYLLKPVTGVVLHQTFDAIVKHRNKGIVSLASYVDWIENIGQEIWMLQTEQLDRLLVDWRAHLQAAGLSVPQLQQLLDDAVGMIFRRLVSKGYMEVSVIESIGHHTVQEQLLNEFELRVKQMTADLVTQRWGNFKNPLDEVKSYIDTHLSEEITLEEVAEMAGYTPTYFSAMFKKMTGDTFVRYRIHRRMERAKELLALPHMRIIDVAANVGYEDYPHFTKMFKKVTGHTPTEYRTMLGFNG